MALQVAFAEQGLALERLGQLGLEAGDRAVRGDVGDLEQVAVRFLEFRHLIGINLEVEAFEMGGGAGGIDALQPVGDEVQAVVERDEVVQLLVFLQPLLLLFVLMLQFRGALLQKRDRLVIGAAAFLHQVFDELRVETVGDQGGRLGVGVAGGDQDDETAAHGLGIDAAQGGGGRRRAGPRP